MEDQVRADQPVDILWSMMTEADIQTDGSTATLKKNGWTVSVEIRTPRHAVFDIAAASVNGYRRLVVRLGDRMSEVDLRVLMTPYKDTAVKPKITGQFPVTSA